MSQAEKDKKQLIENRYRMSQVLNGIKDYQQ